MCRRVWDKPRWSRNWGSRLRNRWGTAGQAEFRLKSAQATESTFGTQNVLLGSQQGWKPKKAPIKARPQANFEDYVTEDRIYQHEVSELERDLQFGFPVKVIDRGYVPNYNFLGCVAVVVVGQDGLVANVAKYVYDTPIVAVNPDPSRIDGLLLPFRTAEAVKVVRQVLDGRYATCRESRMPGLSLFFELNRLQLFPPFDCNLYVGSLYLIVSFW